jgi:hypothetical protein
MVISKIVSLQFQLKKGDMDIKVFPNPATDRLGINLMTPLGDRIIFNLVDTEGRNIREKIHNVEAGFLFRGFMDISGLIPGIYYVKATGKNGFNKVVPIYIID